MSFLEAIRPSPQSLYLLVGPRLNGDVYDFALLYTHRLQIRLGEPIGFPKMSQRILPKRLKLTYYSLDIIIYYIIYYILKRLKAFIVYIILYINYTHSLRLMSTYYLPTIKLTFVHSVLSYTYVNQIRRIYTTRTYILFRIYHLRGMRLSVLFGAVTQ